MSLTFTTHKTEGNARTGTLTTAHGDVRTPAFMPVGTAATVKAMYPDQVKQLGADIILGNTYHLMLRPGAERIAKLGGLHHFMQWNGPILTDSGGFQVMSLSGLRHMGEEGVTFQSHIDGSRHLLSPERSIEIQHLLGSDITMIFDECTPFPATHTETEDSMRLSLRWAERSRNAFIDREGHGLFGIAQGGMYEDLRQESAHELLQMDFDGMAIGGLAVGEGQNEMFRMLDITCPLIPNELPRYLMGVGTPADIVGAVLRGVDMFDCVMPTRSGRNAKVFTDDGAINLRNARYAEDPTSLDKYSNCPASRDYSKAYLHHLFKAKEMLGPMLLTWHNLHYYQQLMQRIRAHIEDGTFGAFAEEFLAKYGRETPT